MIERWKPIVDYDGLYEVSDLGRVRSLVRITKRGRRGGRFLTPLMAPNGYVTVVLSKPPNIRRERRYIHHLVLKAFVGDRPDGAEACHDPDPDKANCALKNLRWDTPRNNNKDKLRHGTQARGEAHQRAILSEQQAREILSGDGPQRPVADRMGVTAATVSAIRRGRIWKHLEPAK